MVLDVLLDASFEVRHDGVLEDLAFLLSLSAVMNGDANNFVHNLDLCHLR